MATENIDDYRWQHRLSAIKYTVHAGNLLYWDAEVKIY